MVERPSTPPADEASSEAASHNDDALSDETKNKAKETENETNKTLNDDEESEDAIDAAMKRLDDVGEKAVNTAREWGSYLFSVGKVAGQTFYDKAKDTASLLKHTVEDKTLIGDFKKEQDKFITDKRDKTNRAEAALPPWVGYNEEEEMKAQILALSQDRRNFLRNPPSGVQFQFDFASTHPVAMATLLEDENLQKMRFELVPKQIKEEQFWRNYFYRVSLIKQSTQLTSLTQETGGDKSSGSSHYSSTDSLHKERSASQPVAPVERQSEVDLLPDSPTEHEFASDAFDEAELNEEDLRNEMKQLGVEEVDKKVHSGDDEDDSAWEKELQKELQEYEMVAEGDQDYDDELESEILQQIQDEANIP